MGAWCCERAYALTWIQRAKSDDCSLSPRVSRQGATTAAAGIDTKHIMANRQPLYVKLWHDWLDDARLRRLSRSAQLQFWELVTLAAKCNADGYLIDGAKPMTIEDIAWMLREPLQRVEFDIWEISATGLVALDKDIDAWLIVNFTKRQEIEEDAKRREQTRERTRRWREKCDALVTPSQERHKNSVTPISEERRKEESTSEERRSRARKTTAQPSAPIPPPTSTPPPESEPPTFADIPSDLRSQSKPPRAKPDYFQWEAVKVYMTVTGKSWIPRECADYLNENVPEPDKFGQHLAFFKAQGWGVYFDPKPERNKLANVIDHYRNDRPLTLEASQAAARDGVRGANGHTTDKFARVAAELAAEVQS